MLMLRFINPHKHSGLIWDFISPIQKKEAKLKLGKQLRKKKQTNKHSTHFLSTRRRWYRRMFRVSVKLKPANGAYTRFQIDHALFSICLLYFWVSACIALHWVYFLFCFCFFILERGGFLRGGEVFLLVCGRCEQKLLHFYAALWKKFVSVFRKFFFFFWDLRAWPWNCTHSIWQLQ